MGTLWGREPAMIVAAVAAAIQALVIFGVVTWTDAQVDSLLAAVNAVMLLLVGGVVRSKVYSPSTVRRMVETGRAQP